VSAVKFRLACLVLLGLAAGCATYDPAHAPTCSSDGCAFAERVADLPMANVARLDDGVWRGGAPGDAGLKALKEKGFKTVVDLRAGADERRAAESLGLKLVAIPLYARLTCVPPDAKQVCEFLDVVTDPANRPVYVHCELGRDRTGTMCALYRMEVDGWTRARALEEMHAFGFHTWYGGFLQFLGAYECAGKWRAAPPVETGAAKTTRSAI